MEIVISIQEKSSKGFKNKLKFRMKVITGKKILDFEESISLRNNRVHVNTSTRMREESMSQLCE